jgi:hypothetical protein
LLLLPKPGLKRPGFFVGDNFLSKWIFKVLFLHIPSAMRGKKALYEDLIPSSIGEPVGQKSQRNTFLDERDEAMVHRYYFHAHICRKRFDDCLLDLSREFFLSHNVITQRLLKKDEDIKGLILEGVQPHELRKKYPHFVWNR